MNALTFILALLVIEPIDGYRPFFELNETPEISQGFGGNYDSMKVGDPELFWDGNHLLLYYTATGADGIDRIALARSTHLENWEPMGIVLGPGFPGNFDEDGVSNPDIIATEEGIEMHYTGDRNGWKSIGRVISQDGYQFIRYLGNTQPLISYSFNPDRFDYLGVTQPTVTEYRGAKIMLYRGIDGTPYYRIGLAYSNDGQTYYKVDGEELGAVFGRGPVGYDDAGAQDPEFWVFNEQIRFLYTSFHY